MASTGAYRQAMQQIFAISIEDELFQQSNNDSFQNDNVQEGFGPLQGFDESGQSEPVVTNNIVNNRNSQVTNIQNNQPVNSNEITDDYIDRELADFLNAG